MAVGDRVRLLRDREDVPLGSVGVILGVIFAVPEFANEIAVKFDGKSLVVPADDLELVEAVLAALSCRRARDLRAP